ncbi:MAG: phenylalanyl-tRNA synthetase, beta subunit [Haloquadratum sp. J07HQX50]|nr:MAG: phenylalanyl-tRNA synthetase, beta subunit [Haloquadratum sp. J07HQX50]
MPVVDIDIEQLRSLTGRTDQSVETFKTDLFDLGLEFEGKTEQGKLQFEFGPDRLDRLSVEGVARSLRYHYGLDRGVEVLSTNDAEFTIEVTDTVPSDRPYVTAAIARGVRLDRNILDSLIQLQEKLHATIGRQRAKGAIGIHDLTMLKGHRVSEDASGPSITYTGVDPSEDCFVPLDADRELTPQEVLDEHPTGRKYAELVSEYDRYPAIYDELGLFSFPPVINGRRTEVSTNSRDLLIELTGTDQWTIDRMGTILCYALSARGASIESVKIDYDDRQLIRPDLSVETKQISHERIETVLGVTFSSEELISLFERAGLNAHPADTSTEDDINYTVSIPPYRVDVLHPLDLVDDVGRAYGFDNLSPRYPDVGTVGSRHERSRLEAAVRTLLTGLGFEDLLNFHMTNETRVFDRMSLLPSDDAFGAKTPVEITEPYSEEYEILRPWLLPSLITVLENNTHRPYPQNLAEVGFVAHNDPSSNTRVEEKRHVGAVLARHDATYEDAKAHLQLLCENVGVSLRTPATSHPSFIDGRTAACEIDGEQTGVIGEIHPSVLVKHNLELPVVGFEFELNSFRE